MKNILIFTTILLLVTGGAAVSEQFSVVQDEQGWALLKDGESIPVYGMVWTPTPIGENYTFNLWNQPYDYIKKTIDIDFALMQDMGVNMIRSFATIPPEWVEYIYDTYGIYTAINYLFARYGVSVNNKWYPRTDYSMEDTRKHIIGETINTVETYKDVRGVSMFLLGNENNYGLEWKSDAIEDLPVGEQHKEKARYLYSLYGQAVSEVQKRTDLPVGIVNGDIQYVELIKEYVDSMDFLATNVYRGKLVYDPSNEYSSPFYERVQEVLDKPILYSEFGSDAYNTITKSEDQFQQADFLKSQWREIYEQSYGKGRTQSSLGGFVFSWMDEWWKNGLTENLDSHQTRGSWINGGYSFDFIPEQWNIHKNMNEEWLGIVYQSEDYYGGYYGLINKRIPRAAYYTLGEIWQEDMYTITDQEVSSHFDDIRPEINVARASELINTETNRHGGWAKLRPSLHGAMRGHWGDAAGELDFSFEQLVYLQTELQPTEYFGARINLRFQYEALDDVLFDSYSYKSTKGDELSSNDFDYKYGSFAAQLYSSSFLLETDYFDLEGFYHDGYRLGGHKVWYEEGDFFGLLPESFYLVDLDRNFSKAPFGLQLSMKQYVEGLKVYAGPELFDGARPSIMAKYFREFWGSWGAVRVGAMHEEELDEVLDPPSRYLPPLARKTSLQLGYSTPAETLAVLHVDAGGLWSGMERLDEEYQRKTENTADGRAVTVDTINILDTFAGKLALTLDFNTNPVFSIDARYSYSGAVASARAIKNYDGTKIVDNGTANRQEIYGSFSLYYENFHILAGSLWRTPLVRPLSDYKGGYVRAYAPDGTGQTTSPILVNGNRETLQFELLATYDFTGATYFYEWNNDDREDAIFAAGLGFHYTAYNGATDALKFIDANASYHLNDGSKTPYQDSDEVVWAEGLGRVENLYAASLRLISNFAPLQKLIFTARLDETQNTGQPDIDTQFGYGAKLQYFVHQVELMASFDYNAWGPEDWHVEFGWTVPWQYALYAAYHFEKLSSLSPGHIVYAQFRGRELEGLEADVHKVLNPLGQINDLRRFELTLGYSLQF